MLRTTSTVHPLDFGQLSGHEFERLVFALLCRRWPWSQLDWLGQLGNDGGRDIWGLRENDWGREELVIVACANWQRLTAGKAIGDIDKVVANGKEVPDHLIVVAGGKVSAELKQRVRVHSEQVGIHRSEVWSGPELEELLRFHAHSVLHRFFNGEPLPDEPNALLTFVANTPATDDEALRVLGRLFDRPAFYTPFQAESSLPAFRRAISDTIEALNTGIYRNRNGDIISRVAGKNDFSDQAIRKRLDSITRNLNRLRVAFDSHLRNGTIEPCKCGVQDCPTFLVHDNAARELDQIRRNVLRDAHLTFPEFSVRPDF